MIHRAQGRAPDTTPVDRIVKAQHTVDLLRRTLAEATEARAQAIYAASHAERVEAAQALGKPLHRLHQMMSDRRRPPGWSPK